jgi:hypothetical protein
MPCPNSTSHQVPRYLPSQLVSRFPGTNVSFKFLHLVPSYSVHNRTCAAARISQYGLNGPSLELAVGEADIFRNGCNGTSCSMPIDRLLFFRNLPLVRLKWILQFVVQDRFLAHAL